ncbi:MAG: hypothetical protein ACYCQI_01100 [Gammaproteobacteria bacterium]
MPNFFARLVPFLFLGIAIVAFAFGLILLTYLFVFGAIVGLTLFLIVWIRDKFFPSKSLTKPQKRKGRTIDHE